VVSRVARGQDQGGRPPPAERISVTSERPVFDPAAYGRHIAAAYDAVHDDLPTDAAVGRLAALAAGGAVLELGIGTGRLALPLLERGLDVAGIEASPDMVDRLHAKPRGREIPVAVGDFARTRLDRRFALVVLAFNTIFALPDQDAQVACFAGAAAHLEPGGAFVVETWVPDVGAFRRDAALRVLAVGQQRVLLEAAEIHPADQTMTTTKVALSNAGVQLIPANHRYAWPAELDLMARIAGLRREHRWENWTGASFTDTSATHISVYRAPGAPLDR
jgi:SAM-dependent methyltransferase